MADLHVRDRTGGDLVIPDTIVRVARLNPDRRVPTVLLDFPRGDTYRGRPLKDFLRRHLSGALWWNGKTWETNGVGVDPTGLLHRWGFTITDDLSAWSTPVTKLSRNRRQVLVRPRLTGRAACQEMLGLSAVWDQRRGLFRLPVADVCPDGHTPIAGMTFSAEAVALSHARHRVRRENPALGRALTHAATALRPGDLSRADRDLMVDRVGRIPDWFGVDLYPYQKVGAMAVACGRRLLADEPGVGKTYQSIAAATLMGARRLLVVAPPLAVTNWLRELAACGVAAADATGRHFALSVPDGTRRKVTTPPGDDPVRPVAVVVSDSLLASRDGLQDTVTAWRPDVIIWDEAHRGKTYGTRRSESVLQVAADTGAAGIAVTGTPMLKSPAELAPLMEFTGQDVSAFGGLANLLAHTCTLDRYGRLRPRRDGEAWLTDRLHTRVMVRRRKVDVLPQLPPKYRYAIHVDVPLAEFHRTHRQVERQIDTWLERWRRDHGVLPDDEVISEWATGNLAHISQLRRAAGLAKVDAACTMIADHLAQTRREDGIWDDPLIVWTHHRDVTEALAARVPGLDGAAMIVGGMDRGRRDRLIDAFQAGLVGALVCSTHAAGVAVTLTRCHTMLFVETDWTPGIVVQAEDRAHRPGQTAGQVSIGTLIADGTLDPVIQRTLARKAGFLDATLGGDNRVAVDGDGSETATGLLVDLVVARRDRLAQRAQ